jgi:hypothetical protein
MARKTKVKSKKTKVTRILRTVTEIHREAQSFMEKNTKKC